MIDRTPQIFISYSWDTKADTKELAEKLMHDGVEVIFDVWSLKPGQDKYVFMEQCVTNPDVDRVLIICDKSYTEKANSRSGGVGDETMIISPEVYNKAQQEKFIPVVIEKNETGEPFLPVYIRNRIYIDISGDHYEEGYNQLLRTIYEQPEHRKPSRGTPPDFLSEEAVSLFPIKDEIRKLSSNNFKRLNSVTAENFITTYLDSLKGFYREENFELNEFLADFRVMKEHRNYFMAFINLVAESDKIKLGEFIAKIFERIYNTLSDLHFFASQANCCRNASFDIFKLHIWELFLCSVTYLLHNELFHELSEVLVHTYFLRRYVLSDERHESTYGAFYFNPCALDNQLKRLHDFKQLLTPIGHLLCVEREYRPIYTGKAIANTDLFLFQIQDGLELGIADSPSWYPMCYIYATTDYSMWQKLKSRKFCERMFKLFDVESMEDLKQKISRCRSKPTFIYDNVIIPAPTIHNFITIQDIGTLP